MADAEIRGLVNTGSPRSSTEGNHEDIKVNKRAEVCVIDWFTQMAMEGRIFEVRIGNVTTPVTGDIAITDTKAEASTDAALGTTVIPVYLNVDLESFAGGTIPECAAKGVAAVSTSGTVFVPLPRMTNGNASTCVCRVSVAGGVVVTAEAVTTTNRYFGSRVTAQADWLLADHQFRPPPILKGAACFYLQVAAETAGPVYFANYDYIELPSASI